MLLGFLEAGLFVTDAECETVLDLCSTSHTQTPRYNQLIAVQALMDTANNNI